ncbi:4-(cytidine 5'-diphospho)-2-C-methyl-D-erythritol kinase [uncultured Draconibacterium sp.]|uniref:4-(cytidine 5'-diphospho)-2-C-methyl-D-erythritol kinase n=1 Tax=uncultured Draconibacterium sp. TaxID=1573823 RepID=UPI003261652D
MISFPNAKINIGLNVVEKRADGYHNIETLFYPVGLCDVLELAEATEPAFSSSGIEIDAAPENNLVFKAYKLLKTAYNLPPIKFHLHKLIPFGAGLGGGSADAAFALKMLNEFFQLQLTAEELRQFASKIGADCPFFIENQPTFAYGIGNRFKPIELDLSDYKIVIVKPNVSVSTPQAYKNIVPQKAQFNLLNIATLPVDDWKDVIKNDFERSVLPQFPEIAELKEKLYQLGAVYAAMSGSGSAVFGLFRHLPTDLANSLPKGIFIYR